MAWLVSMVGAGFGALAGAITGALAAAYYKTPWKLEGSDCFDGSFYRLMGPYGYPIPRRHPELREPPKGKRRRVWLIGLYAYQADAERGARKWLEYLDSVQPPAVSGGQFIGGMQDHVWIIRPDGERLRYSGPPSGPDDVRADVRRAYMEVKARTKKT